MMRQKNLFQNAIEFIENKGIIIIIKMVTQSIEQQYKRREK